MERSFYEFVQGRQVMLDDMAGPYTSLALVSGQLMDDRSFDGGEHIGYFEVLPSWVLHSRSVYGIANALKVPLTELPAIVLSAEPSGSHQSLVVSFQVQENDDKLLDARYTSLVMALLAACREAADEPVKKRLRIIESRMKNLRKGERPDFLSRFSQSGLLSQIIEGIVRGIG
jgi:hypothetical protein